MSLMEPYIPPALKREMRGVAVGSGVSYRDVLFFNCFDDVLHSLVRLALSLPPQARARLGMACSSFVSIPNTPHSRILVGRNLDYYLEGGVLGADGIVTRTMKELLVCYVVRPQRGESFVSIGWPGFVGVVTGLNASGLTLACLTSAVPGQTPRGTPLTLLYRELIEKCKTVGEAERMLRRSQRTIGNNVVLVSPCEREAALMEFTPRAVRRSSAHDGRIVSTNHFQNMELAASQLGWVIPNSLHRRDRLHQLCAGADVSVQDAQRMLLDTVVPTDTQAEAFSCLLNPGTVYSTVIEPESLRLWLRANDRPSRTFVQIDAGAEMGRARSEAVQPADAQRRAAVALA
jgi:isopenicillin-N N-acyltransferase like protein